MSSRFRCTPNDAPFFRLLLSFHSVTIINRYCQSFKILNNIRSHFEIAKSSLPIVLHEVTTNEEIFLANDTVLSKPINAGLYLAFLKYNDIVYQPLIDFKLTPMEIVPEKLLLPKSIPFIIYNIHSFVKALANLIDYTREYEKTKSNNYRKCGTVKNECNIYSLMHTFGQPVTTKRSKQTKSQIARASSTNISSDLLVSPVSRLSIIPTHTNYDTDIRRYLTTDVQRTNRTSLINHTSPFSFRILNREEQRIQQQAATIHVRYPPLMNIFEISPHIFNENELVLLHQNLCTLSSNLSMTADLKNCIHQLAIDKTIDKPQVCDLLLKLNHKLIHNQIHHKDILKIIQDLQEAASSDISNISQTNLSDLLATLLRMDYLTKFNKIDKQSVHIFYERLNHLARMGALNQNTKIFKKIYQLDLSTNESNQIDFVQIIETDLQQIIPQSIPLNDLGIKEVVHQLRLNTDRLGLVLALILIDNLQRLAHSGLLVHLYKTPHLKRYLIQFIEQVQTSQFNGNRLQRLMDQINNCLQMDTTTSNILANQLNSFLQKTKLLSRTDSQNRDNHYDTIVAILLNLSNRGQLNMFHDVITQEYVYRQVNIDCNSLQSVLTFLYGQSISAMPSGPLQQDNIDDFIRYLRLFSQYGILHEPTMFNILIDLQRAKDRYCISVEIFQVVLKHMKTINYINAYGHLNLPDVYKFLNDTIHNGYITRGQAWVALDRLVNLCQIEPITNHDIKTLLTNIQLEYNRQQPIYSKLIDAIQFLAESYSTPLSELRFFERELQKLLSSSYVHNRRISDEIRKCLNDIISCCKMFSNNYILLKKLFDEKVNHELFDKMKELLKSKHFLSRKRSVTAILQLRKQFWTVSRSITEIYLNENQLDQIIQIIRTQCTTHKHYIEKILETMAQIGYLQDVSFVNYLNETFLLNANSTLDDAKCREIRMKLQKTWPWTLNLNHSEVRSVVEHLQQLEHTDKLHSGAFIEIQNQLNQLARFGKCSSPKIKFLINELQIYQGRAQILDKNSFQLIESYRCMLNDVSNAIEFEFYIQQLNSENKLTDELTYCFRHFLYQILQNQLSIDELSHYRVQLNRFHCLQQMDIEEVTKFIELLPKEFYKSFPMTLTDKLLKRLKFDEKLFDESLRNQLLKFEYCGALSRDNFEDIYNNLHRTSDLSSLSLESSNHNQLLIELFDKVNDLYNDSFIDLQTLIDVKEEVYFLEDIKSLIEISEIITFQSCLLNSTNKNDFLIHSQKLKAFVYQEQYRLSDAQDLISTWHLNERRGNFHEKQILTLFHELANLNQLYNESNAILLNRYIGMKQVNASIYRQLIKDLQRLKDRAFIDRQITKCIRSIEVELYSKIDYRHRLSETFIKQVETRVKQSLQLVTNSFEQHLRNEICMKLHELIEGYVKSNENEYSFDELLTKLDSLIGRVKSS